MAIVTRNEDQQRAVVLLSGGLDSATTLAVAQAEGYKIHALTFQYGQRHDIEVKAAERIASVYSVARHVIIPINLRTFGGSALTGSSAVPKDRDVDQMSQGIPSTYVPARNTIFLSFALALSEVIETGHIFIGVNALDYSGYPDCRPEYIAAVERMANLATRAGVEGRTKLTIHTPLIAMTKAQIITRGLQLGVDFSLTTSCYDPQPGDLACGHCDACILRLKGFAEVGINDPIPYDKS